MSEKSFLFLHEPRWQKDRQGSQISLPEPVQSWTYEPGSLTQRLRHCYGNAVTVKILHQRRQTPFLSERISLNLPQGRSCLIREVLLHALGKPLLLARTVIPDATVKAAHRHLSQLGTRPLGEVIFSYRNLERHDLELALIQPLLWQAPAIQLACIRQPIHGRRTIYAINQQPMLVSEFFLPEILNVI